MAFTLQNRFPSQKYGLFVLTVIFSSDIHSPGNHQPNIHLPAFNYLPLFLFCCPSLSNLEIIFHNWPPTTYCLPVTLLTLCLPDWLVHYVFHSPDDLQIAWYLSQACFSSAIFILGILQHPPAAILSLFAVLHLPLWLMPSLEREETHSKKVSYLLWVHTCCLKTTLMTRPFFQQGSLFSRHYLEVIKCHQIRWQSVAQLRRQLSPENVLTCTSQWNSNQAGSKAGCKDVCM